MTRLKVDAIVNAANSALLGCFVPCHRCIDNAIHSGAGMELREECNKIMNQRKIKYGTNYEEPTGTATITEAYNLPCKKVIHTVGPICYFGLNDELCNDLKNCYESVLNCCAENGLKTVAFCCISTGEFRFPNKEAAVIAKDTVERFLMKKENNIERVIFCVYKDLDREIYDKLYNNTIIKFHKFFSVILLNSQHKNNMYNMVIPLYTRFTCENANHCMGSIHVKGMWNCKSIKKAS